LIGLIPEGRIPYIGIHVSYQLAATCGLYPEACAAAVVATAETSVLTWALFGSVKSPEGDVDNHKEGDAFQHCYWSGLITLAVGAGKAEKVTTRFEAYGTENPEAQRRYDMDSNKRGREFAQNLVILEAHAHEGLSSWIV
jgi:hypothetical protein